jgi:glycosyltransferase involved in cell wall biosynthesis
MKILMITPYLPYPPSSGGQVRSYNLIKNLSEKDELNLVSLIKNPDEKQYVQELKKYCQRVLVFNRPRQPWTLRNVFKTGFSLDPFLVVRNFSNEAKKAVGRLIQEENFDLIHAETFYVMPHIPPTRVPILLVEQTIEYQVYAHFVRSLSPGLFFLKPLLFIDLFKLKWWEKYYWSQADLVIAVSEADKKKMTAEVKNLKVRVVPNGAGEDLMALWGKRKPVKKPTVFFQANFNWLQNTEAAQNLAQKVLPLVKKKIPVVQCWIVGQEAREKVGCLASRDVKVINLETPDIKGVIKAYQGASVFVAPLQGPGGTRLKILAAMAAGVPVVTTSVGIEGIMAKDGKEALISDNWQEMAKDICRLIKQKSFYQNIAQSARKLVEKHYSYRNIAGLLDRAYREVSGGRS